MQSREDGWGLPLCVLPARREKNWSTWSLLPSTLSSIILMNFTKKSEKCPLYQVAERAVKNVQRLLPFLPVSLLPFLPVSLLLQTSGRKTKE